MALAAACGSLCASAERVWTLQECIDYAIKNNITLKKTDAQIQMGDIDIADSKAAWLPTMSANLNESAMWRPLQESEVNYVNGGMSVASAKKTTESGSYGINAGWTVYNGKQRKMNIQNAELSKQISILSAEQQQDMLTEQIAQLYVQILYMEEALKVNERILAQDSAIWQRGVAFMENGKIAKASVLELEATVASGRYDVVNTRTQIAQAKLQLAQLLELPAGESIEVMGMEVADEMVRRPIPPYMEVYAKALNGRPEMESAQLSIEQAQLATKIAKAARIPTISLNAGVNDSHMTGAVNAFGKQLKNNLNATIGVGVIIPILDQKRVKHNVERAKINELTAQLDMADKQKNLYQSIEQYWLNATNSQQKYMASQSNVASREASYELLDEQFKVGLKNISDLLQSRQMLLMSKQTLLQDKYTTLLNRALLDFYEGKEIEL